VVVALDELGAELHHRAARQLAGVDPAADPVAGLQHHRLGAAIGQGRRRGQPGEARPDHADAHGRRSAAEGAGWASWPA
jgi:hypothetical protein